MLRASIRPGHEIETGRGGDLVIPVPIPALVICLAPRDVKELVLPQSRYTFRG
jgi:hypothetical protein